MSKYFPMNKPIGIISYSCASGPLEKKGPLGYMIDYVFEENSTDDKTYEKFESSMFKNVVNSAIEKSGISRDDIDFMSGGDLLNQISSSNYSARDLQIPFFGIYGACSTFSESLLINSMILSSYGRYAISATSSHFSTAERQYRFPLEFGNQRASTTQWTVTGAGAIILSSTPKRVNIIDGIIGKIIDLGIKDAANMGAAMAPAAADTISNYFVLSGKNLDDYDYIITGDLGILGSKLLILLLKDDFNIDISQKHIDCGVLIYGDDKKKCCGGSGCGCSALYICAKILNMLDTGEIKRVLYVATGALLSTTSIMQGESIPGICHGVTMERSDINDIS